MATVQELEDSIVGLQETLIGVQDHVAAMAADALDALRIGDKETLVASLAEIITKFGEDPADVSELERITISLADDEEEDAEEDEDEEDDAKKEEDEEDDEDDEDEETELNEVSLSEIVWGVELGEVVGQPIQIFRTGDFDHPKYGKLVIDDKLLGEIKKNFDARVRGQDIPIDHEHKNDEGAVGWFKELQLKKGELWAVPAWSEEAAAEIKDGKYRYMSPQFGPWKDPESGKLYNNVLMSAALTNYPFLKNMAPVELNEFRSWQKEHTDNRKEGPVTDPVNLQENAEFVALKEAFEQEKARATALAEKVELMERITRANRFSDLAKAGDWNGDIERHVRFMETLADSVGEDSDEFKFYVETQNAQAAQLAESGLFTERGTPGSGVPLASDTTIQAKAREMMASGEVRTLSEAIERAIQTDPRMYEQYNREHMQRVRAAV